MKKEIGSSTEMSQNVEKRHSTDISEAQDTYLSRIPISYRSAFKKALKRQSRASAMKAQCQQCVGYQDVANSIRGCQSFICPLWAYRPYQQKRGEIR